MVTLTPEEVSQTIAQFKALPEDKKNVFRKLLKSGCSWCEQEFNIPNVSLSHGMCTRHMIKFYKDNDLGEPEYSDSGTIDLANLSPEDIQLAIKLFAVYKSKTDQL